VLKAIFGCFLVPVLVLIGLAILARDLFRLRLNR
jgi:hypothetical protein